MKNSTLFICNLVNIDFSVSRNNRFIGYSVTIDTLVRGSTDNEGMIIDFGTLKSAIRNVVEEELDHKLVIDKYSIIQLSVPKTALCVVNINIDRASEEDLLKELSQLLIVRTNKIISNTDITIDIILKKNKLAKFNYSHFLPLHNGCCQRIVHGHSSNLEINFVVTAKEGVDGLSEKSRLYEVPLIALAEMATNYLVGMLNNKYFVCLKYIKTSGYTFGSCHITNPIINTIDIGYTGTEGSFFLKMSNTSDVIVLPEESTVENIANYILSLLLPQIEEDNLIKCLYNNPPLDCNIFLDLKVYEGIDKGVNIRKLLV